MSHEYIDRMEDLGQLAIDMGRDFTNQLVKLTEEHGKTVKASGQDFVKDRLGDNASGIVESCHATVALGAMTGIIERTLEEITPLLMKSVNESIDPMGAPPILADLFKAKMLDPLLAEYINLLMEALADNTKSEASRILTAVVMGKDPSRNKAGD